MCAPSVLSYRTLLNITSTLKDAESKVFLLSTFTWRQVRLRPVKPKNQFIKERFSLPHGISSSVKIWKFEVPLRFDIHGVPVRDRQSSPFFQALHRDVPT